MQQVNLMGITIKSLAEIEEEVSRGLQRSADADAAGPECKAKRVLGVVIKCVRQRGPVGCAKPRLNKKKKNARPRLGSHSLF